MNWIFGNQSNLISLSEIYWRSTAFPAKESQFHHLLLSESLFLTAIECQNLKNLTYMNSLQPFGLVGDNSTVGTVEIDASICESFRLHVTAAIEILNYSPSIKLLKETLVRKFIPLCESSPSAPLREHGSGKSAHWIKGGIFLSLPNSHPFPSMELALNISHEIGHQALMIYQECDKIISDPHQMIYSTIRKAMRPAILSLHAVFAVYFMLCISRELIDNYPLTDKENEFLRCRIRELRKELASGLFALKDAKFTDFGLRIIKEITASSIHMGIDP